MVSKTLCYTPGNSYVIASSRTEATKYGKIRYNYGAYPVSKRKHSESEWLEKSNVKGEMKTAQDTQELAVSLGDPTPSEPAPEAKEGRDTTLPRDAATVDRAPVVSKKQAQWTPASIPRTVKQERAIPTRLSGRDRLANRLPRGFINDVTDPMRYFFIGFYTGSGCHSSTAPGFRIVLKACEFISLYNLLYRCGVPKPNLKFYKNGRISSKYNAGHIGYVLWSYKSRTENSSAIVDLGLPSSQSHRSDLVLLQNFLPKNCPERIEHFLIFLFGYIMANGLVDWTHGSNQQQPELWYSGVQLGATDTGLLCWFSTNLISIGFQSLRRAARDTNKGKEQHTPNSAARHILYIPSTDENNSILARGINLLEQHNIPLNGKLQMLRKYLQSDGRISENFFCPRRLSFHQYIHNVKNDRTACVIAQ
ncbi:hypothetical protein BCR43DRAFT_517472 [Syncephalastrum racemosum]|uniref:Uncharacterized protein n=1 Tax=Syncephalastrum racemosum TaxID=13706 RepID=A0A1X2H469_SYNRA|nr:hypothetical protein BCR43DRAFT_517472 [Syncephalastrum racemosum]